MTKEVGARPKSQSAPQSKAPAPAAAPDEVGAGSSQGAASSAAGRSADAGVEGEIASQMRANLGTMNHASLLALSRMCVDLWPLAGEMVQAELTRRGSAVKEEPDEKEAPDEASDTRPPSFERFAHANRTRCVDD